ncbi:hypothetical protein L873DRAFT_1811164 [Choiromyces venosus 120613-1]|uniref:Calponin-homology (CH) domain-containing protein n=1 Tax=Choiromyces venosus 120613-1 TaxID=1336337 RepID=A0A3N4JE54_9PEZI|nr:hypothetical protein L873DRAFT_1811164 [Choiromyces venosus 120613-1]
MASVSSLDRDLSRLRLGKYTPQASQEIKDWITATLNENIGNEDLMVALKDGTILCRLANLLEETPQIRFKKSAMPFVQMENISHFLSFVARPPVSLPPHDLFLTVDLFEQKDPAQVCQCITSYSRIAHKLKPGAFPTTIGALKVTAQLSPQLSGGAGGFWAGGARKVSGGSVGSGGGASVVSGYSGSGSTAKPSVPPRKATVSTWSKSSDESATLPAWNIAQYGYMGGASQGNQGISFGARRQITNNPVVKSTPATSPPPPASSFAEKRRKEGEAKKLAADAEAERRRESQAAEERRRTVAEADRWRMEEGQKAAMELERRKWVEQEERDKADRELECRKWKEEEEKRRLWQIEQNNQRELERQKEEYAFERREEEARRVRDREAQMRLDKEKKERERERERIRELERELEKARERERVYEAEKEERRRQDTERMRRDAQEMAIRKHRTGEPPSTPSPSKANFIGSHRTGDRDRDQESERMFLQTWQNNNTPPPQTPPRHKQLGSPIPQPRALPTPPPRKLPPAPITNHPSTSNTYYTAEPMQPSRSWETNDDASGPDREQEELEKQQAYKWASMSLLERERERERQRQKEWEANQREVEQRAPTAATDDVAWDVNQYGYLGGADQGKMGVALGARRQIIGPRGRY